MLACSAGTALDTPHEQPLKYRPMTGVFYLPQIGNSKQPLRRTWRAADSLVTPRDDVTTNVVDNVQIFDLVTGLHQLQALGICRGLDRHIPDLTCQLFAVLKIELHECHDLGPQKALFVDVYEEWSSQRFVFTG